MYEVQKTKTLNKIMIMITKSMEIVYVFISVHILMVSAFADFFLWTFSTDENVFAAIANVFNAIFDINRILLAYNIETCRLFQSESSNGLDALEVLLHTKLLSNSSVICVIPKILVKFLERKVFEFRRQNGILNIFYSSELWNILWKTNSVLFFLWWFQWKVTKK